MSTRFMPKYVRDELLSYLNNTNREPHPLSKGCMEWVLDTPNLRPHVPKVLYRGLYLPGEEGRSKWESGTDRTEKFEHLTSWASRPCIATSFALNSSSTIFRDMKSDFLEACDTEPEKYTPFGVVLGAVVDRKNIFLSTELLRLYYDVAGKYGREWEYITRPKSEIRFRILKTFSKGNIRHTTHAAERSTYHHTLIDRR